MNIKEGTLQVVLAVLKVLEANYMAAYVKQAKSKSSNNVNKDTRKIRAREATRIISKLNSEQKQAFRTVLLSMILMTAGSVATVRNPDLYKSDGTKSLKTLMNEYTLELWKTSGGPDAGSYIPTNKDYVTAKKTLPIVSSIPSDRQEILKIIKNKGFFGDPSKFADESDIKLAQVLYRGLHSMSNQSLMFLFFSNKPSWDITRAVSTSEDREASIAFANNSMNPEKKDGWSMLFEIQNKDKRGFDVGSLSYYGGEDEYLLSGVLTIDAVGLQLGVVNYKTGERDPMNIYRSSSGELNIDFLNKKYRGKDASNIFLSILQDKPAKNNRYDDFGEMIGSKISIFRVGNEKYTYTKLGKIYVNATVQTN